MSIFNLGIVIGFVVGFLLGKYSKTSVTEFIVYVCGFMFGSWVARNWL